MYENEHNPVIMAQSFAHLFDAYSGMYYTSSRKDIEFVGWYEGLANYQIAQTSWMAFKSVYVNVEIDPPTNPRILFVRDSVRCFCRSHCDDPARTSYHEFIAQRVKEESWNNWSIIWENMIRLNKILRGSYKGSYHLAIVNVPFGISKRTMVIQIFN